MEGYLKNKVTFLIPLLDRPNYTKDFLKYNIFDEFNYLFADGSTSNKNEKIFSKINSENIIYKRFQSDKSHIQFYKKMHEASKMVKTKYIMTCDNDDFINRKGVNKLINILEIKKKYDLGIGYIAHVFFRKNKFRLAEISNSLDTYDNKNRSQILNKEFFINYRHLWYAIFKTEVFTKIWSISSRINISNPQFQELFCSLYVFSCHNYLFISTSHYSRRINTKESGASKAVLNKSLIKKDVEKITSIIEKKIKLDKIKFQSNLNCFFDKSRNRKKKNLFIRILKKVFYHYYSLKLNNRLILHMAFLAKFNKFK